MEAIRGSGSHLMPMAWVLLTIFAVTPLPKKGKSDVSAIP